MPIFMKRNKKNPDRFSITSWIYDDEKKESFPKVIGHINLNDSKEIPNDIMELIDNEDKPEIKAWFRSMKHGREMDALRNSQDDFINACAKIERGCDLEVFNFDQIKKIREAGDSAIKSIRRLERKLSPEKNEHEPDEQEKNEPVAHTENNPISIYP